MSATVATNLMSWFSASAMQSLGWALVHFLWQGTALAAMAAAAMALCRRPSARYAVGIVALALMMLAPVATYFFFHTQQSSGLAETQESSPIAAVATPI